MSVKRALLIFALATSVLGHKQVVDEEAVEEQDMGEVDLSSLVADDQDSKNKVETDEPKKATKKRRKQKWDFDFFWTNYFVEMCILGGFAGAIIVMFYGKSENRRIVEAWHAQALKEIAYQFSYLGLNEEDQSPKLEENSYSEFTYYASGRKNCFYALFKYEMSKRHCLLTQYVFDYILPTQGDLLIVDIPVHHDGTNSGASPILCEFYMTKRQLLKAAEEHNDHFDKLLSAVKCPQIVSQTPNPKDKKGKDNLVVLAEDEASVAHLIDKQSAEILRQFGPKQLVSLHITDCQVYNKYPLFLRARIQIGSTEEEHRNALALLQVVFRVLDRLASFKMNATERAKAEKNRKKILAIKNRDQDEEKQNQLLEKKRIEEQEWNDRYKKMSPEEQRRAEEKKQRQETRKLKLKMIKKGK